MRIAVSGTHSVGKSTLVADILQAFPGYLHEPEPYRALREHYPIKFGKESTRYCNGLQLYYSISRVMSYRDQSSNVVFDRCPVDYIAYSQYTAHYGQTDLDKPFIESFIEPVRQTLASHDMIIFVPISRHHPMHLEADGIRPTDTHYRVEVDRYFKSIYRDGASGLFPVQASDMPGRPFAGLRVIEVQGPRQERIEQVARALQEREPAK
jgi:hypothetical protein